MRKYIFLLILALISSNSYASNDLTINGSSTTHFYVNDGAALMKYNDRMFIGDATENPGTSTGTGDWLTTYEANLQISGAPVGTFEPPILPAAQFGVLSYTNSGTDANAGRFTGVFGCQSKNMAANQGCFALGLVGINNNTVSVPTTTLYVEAHNETSAVGGITAFELDTRTMQASAQMTPYTQNLSGAGFYGVVGIQLASGAGISATSPETQYDASTGLNIQGGPMKFQTGINIAANSITGADGSNGSGQGAAIEMANGHQIEWFDAAGAVIGKVGALLSSTASAASIEFDDFGVDLTGAFKLSSITGSTQCLHVSTTGVVTGTGSDCGSASRPILTSTTNFYVATTGSDSNPCTSGSKCLTIQHGLDVADAYDLNNQTVNVNVADGTYSGGIALLSPTIGGIINLIGDNTTPASCIISVSSNDAIAAANYGVLNVQGFKLQTTTFGSGINASNGGVVNITGNMNFGTIASYGMAAVGNGHIVDTSNYTISGGSLIHLAAFNGGSIVENGNTVTLSGTPTFGQYFSQVGFGGAVQATSITYSGSATGTRYNVYDNGTINVNGGGANYFPGNAAGSTSTGGQYN